MITYHVTWTRLVPKIRKQGLKPMQTSNWTQTASGERYGNGEIFAFASHWDAIRWAAKMEWEFNRTHGSGHVSILTLDHEGDWREDDSDPLTQLIHEDKWLKISSRIPAGHILAVKPFTPDMVKAIVARNNVAWKIVEDLAPEPPIAGESDREYQPRIDAERCTLQLKDALRPARAQASIEDLPLFGGDRQEEMF